MGSLEHAKTELLNFSTWKWKTSSPYLNYTEIYSFAAVFYQYDFYVVGGRGGKANANRANRSNHLLVLLERKAKQMENFRY